MCRSQWPGTFPIYDRDANGNRLVTRTLDSLPDGQILHESRVNALIDAVYDQEQIVDSLEQARVKQEQLKVIINALRPGNEKSRREEDLLDDMIDSIPIVPIRFQEEHQSYLRDRRFFDAQDFVFNISKGRYHALKKQDKLDPDEVDGQTYLYGRFAYQESVGPDFDIHELPVPKFL